MRQLFIIVLSLSLSGTLVGLLIAILHPLTEKYFSKKWNYYIWLLVVARLLIPFHFETNFFAEMPIKHAANTSANFVNTDTSHNTMVNATTKKELISTTVSPQASKSNQVTKVLQNRFNTIVSIWVFVAVIILFDSLLRYAYFLKTVKKNCVRITDNAIINVETFLCAKLNVHQPPALYESSTIFGPVTIGLWNPVIFLPKDFSKEKDLTSLKLILHHELIHIARKDLLYKWVCQLLLCIHWFNPFLYRINKLISSDCELSCDEQILAQLTTFGKQLYGNILLDTAEQTIDRKENVFSTTLLQNKKDLKKRLNHILHYKKVPRFRLLLSTCTFGVALLFTACSPVWISSDSATSYSAKDTASEEKNFFSKALSSLTSSTSFVDNFSSPDKTSDAWKVYDDDILLADKDILENWGAYHYKGGDNKITVSGFVLYGSDTFLVAYADKDVNVKITSSFTLSKGKFKIVHIAPDKSIYTINETGADTTQTISMKQGRNVLKMVGQGAKLTDLIIDYSSLKASSFEKISYSEQEEYITQMKDGMIPLESYNKAKIIDALYYLDAKDASEIFHSLLDAKTDFTTEELYDFFLYSDSTLSSQYLIEALQKGNIAPLNADAITELCPYLQGESITELLQYVPQEEYSDVFIAVLPYLNDTQIENCLSKFMESGGVVTFSMYDKLSPYISKKEILQKLDQQIPQPEQIPQIPQIPN